LTNADAHALIQRPREVLRPFVKEFLIVESKGRRHDTHVPDARLVAAFRLRGECRLNGAARAPRAAITGLSDTMRAHDHGRDHAVLIVRFTAQGAAAIIRQPLDEFANATLDLDAVLGNQSRLDRLHEQLADASNDVARIALVEDFLIAKAGDARPDPLVAAAVASIERTSARVRIETLAETIGLSQSALERRFRRLVGASPRKFASLVRLQHVLRLRDTGVDLTTIAHAAGYFDQSHFIKDFKRFTGLSPASFFAHAAAG
jgi:AraC-like DNA-binding protein